VSLGLSSDYIATTAALFTIAKLWKQPRCPTTDEWINKMWYLYTMEFYAALKKNKILSFTGKWMESTFGGSHLFFAYKKEGGSI
jgi:hypothetical protein